METVRERLVREAAAKQTVLKVRQMDGWSVGVEESDWFLQPDEDGDSIKGLEVYELRNSPPELAVRAHVAAGTAPAVAVRMLRKMADWVERVPGLLEDGPIEPREEDEARVVASLARVRIGVADCARLLRVVHGTRHVSIGERAAWVKVNPAVVGDGPIEPREEEDAKTMIALAGVRVGLPECVRLLRLLNTVKPEALIVQEDGGF